MSVYKRERSPFYQIEFTVNGERFRESSGTTSRREAERILKSRRAEEKEKAKKIKNSLLTLDEAFGRYWTEHAHKLSWAKEVQRYILQILEAIDPDIAIQDISDSEINDFVQHRLKNNGGKYAINRALSVFRSMHNMARKKWKQDIQVVDWSYFKNKEDKRTKFLSLTEANTIINHCPEHIALAIEWSIYTGCRKNETFDLKWSDIDLEEGKATIIKKGGGKHTVWISDQALGVLNRSPRIGRYVFSQVNRRKIWEKAVQKAGLNDVHWHDLRHTHASWLRQAGIALEIVQRSLGHSDITTTTRYAHVDDKELRDALQKLPTLGTHTEKVVSLNRFKSGG